MKKGFVRTLGYALVLSLLVPWAIVVGGCEKREPGEGPGMDTMFEGMVDGIEYEANLVSEEYELVKPGPEGVIDHLGECLQECKTCKKACREQNAGAAPFHQAIRECKKTFMQCWWDNPENFTTCREEAKVCVKAAVDALKPLAECLKACSGGFKECLAEPIADPVQPDPPAQQQPVQPGPGAVDAARACAEANATCQKACTTDLDTVLKPCRDAFDKCLIDSGNPLTCKLDYLKCEQKVREDALAANKTCLDQCAEGFTTCMNAIQQPNANPDPNANPQPDPPAGSHPGICGFLHELGGCVLSKLQCFGGCAQSVGTLWSACKQAYDTCRESQNGGDLTLCRSEYRICVKDLVSGLPALAQECVVRCGGEFTDCVAAIQP